MIAAPRLPSEPMPAVVASATHRQVAVASMVKTDGTTGERTQFLTIGHIAWWELRLRRKVRTHVQGLIASGQCDAVMIDTPKGWRPYR